MAGWVTYKNLPKELWPDIQLPFIYVIMTLEGVSPDDAERLLARPMEQKVRTIEGMKEFRSLTYPGGSSVVMEFQAGYDIDKALDDVREQVDLAKPDLPEDADEPQVLEVAFSRFPILVVTLSGDVPERSLRQLGGSPAGQDRGHPRRARGHHERRARGAGRAGHRPAAGRGLRPGAGPDRHDRRALQPAGGGRHDGHRPGPLRHQGAGPVRVRSPIFSTCR